MMNEEIYIHNIRFRSFVKWNIYLHFCAGTAFGIVLFFIGLLGGNVNTVLGHFQYHGMVAGVASLFLSPFLFIILGIAMALLFYLPLKAGLKITNGIKLKVDYTAN